MSKITVTAAGVTAAGVTRTATTLVDNIVGGILSPLKAFSPENADGSGTYVSEKAAGQGALLAFGAGFVTGDMFGDKVPLLGGRR